MLSLPLAVPNFWHILADHSTAMCDPHVQAILLLPVRRATSFLQKAVS
jgi:hypothetical protein